MKTTNPTGRLAPAVVARSLMRYEKREMCAVECTHQSVEHTLAGARPTVVALSLTCCENRDVCDLKRTPPLTPGGSKRRERATSPFDLTDRSETLTDLMGVSGEEIADGLDPDLDKYVSPAQRREILCDYSGDTASLRLSLLERTLALQTSLRG
jgi:hypothetical protein